jgi:hypothetical protein
MGLFFFGKKERKGLGNEEIGQKDSMKQSKMENLKTVVNYFT